ncbi:MAG: hypothetical protein AB1894_26505 [Chloroflexota bacterium]
MNTFHKAIFYIYGIVCLVTGALLLAAPGRFLGLFGWEPVDPLISRILGAALLGMAWGSWRAVRAGETRLAVVLAEIFMAFSLLSSAGLLRHLLNAGYPFMVWFLCAVLVIFGVLWVVAWLQLRKT